MRTRILSSAAVLLLFATACPAAPPAEDGAKAVAHAKAGADAKSRGAAVARFIDNDTLAVARVDLGRLDPKAIEAWLAGAAKAGGGADSGALVKQLAQARAQSEKWLAEFRKAGGGEVYAVVGVADLAEFPSVILIPLAPGADANALEGLLSAGDPGAPPEQRGGMRFDRVWNVLIGAPDAKALERMRAVKPVERPDLMKALDAAGDAPLAAAAAPSADRRRALHELLPNLPQELGGGPTTVLTRGAAWANLALRPPPDGSLRLVIQSEDAEAAKALGAVVDRALALVAKGPWGQGQEMGKLLGAMKPRAEGDRLLLTLDDPGLRQMAGAFLAGPLRQARANAQWVMSASNMRQILLVCHMWANENNGQWPDDLRPDDLAKALKKYELPATVMDNPLKPGTGYTYVKPPAKVENPSALIVLHDAQPVDGMRTVGFMDGHVERLMEATFQEQLKAQKEVKK